MLKLEVKRLYEGVLLPTRNNPEDAGLDLYANRVEFDEKTQTLNVYTGIAVNIPVGFCGLLFARSSVTKKALMLKNCVGVIDAGYHGEVIGKFKVLRGEKEAGLDTCELKEKILQLVVVPILRPDISMVDEFSSQSARGLGGFGSSDITTEFKM